MPNHDDKKEDDLILTFSISFPLWVTLSPEFIEGSKCGRGNTGGNYFKESATKGDVYFEYRI